MNNEVEVRSQRRRIILMMMASGFLVWQVPTMDLFSAVSAGGDTVKITISAIGFLVWAAGLVALLLFFRTASRSQAAAVNNALEDELVRANRSRAFSVGYFATLFAAAVMFLISLYQPLTGTDSAHMILIVAVAVPLYAFAILERQGA